LSKCHIAKEMLVRLGYSAEELDEIRSLAAWDYGRTVFFARTSAIAGYMSEEEAWRYMMVAADNAAAQYSGWRQFAAAYMMGRAIAYGRNGVDHYPVLDYMLNDPDSPMNLCPLKGASPVPVFEAPAPSDPPDEATVLYNLGMVCYRLDNKTKALECFQQSLDIREKTLPRGHPDVLTVIERVGRVHEWSGNRAEAHAWFEKLLALYEEVEGMDAPATRTIRRAANRMRTLYKNERPAG